MALRSALFVGGVCLTAIGWSLPAMALPRDSDAGLQLRGRHGLMVHAGLVNRSASVTSVSVGDVRAETRVSGFSGSLSYSYWAQEDWSVGLGAGVIDVETMESVSGGGVSNHTSGVVPILFEVAWAPAGLALGPSLRPTFSVGTGPYVGFVTHERVANVIAQETTVESTIGLRARVGVNALLGSWFCTGVEAGYHFVGAFDEPIGGELDYSGPEFSLGFGILLGRPH